MARLRLLLLLIFGIPGCAGILTLLAVKLHHEAFGREVWSNINIQMDAVFLLLIAFKTNYLKTFDQPVGPLNIIQEFHDLRTQILFGLDRKSVV